MVSIIIAAHDEEAVLGLTLDALLAEAPLAHVIVVPNGCSDNTGAIARARTGVDVIELADGGKAAALNAGEAAASSFPRIYLDADIIVPTGAIAALSKALQDPGVLAAAPARRLETSGRPWSVRAYADIQSRLPVFREGLFGRGMIALSAEGRERFGSFPIMVADDLFIDSLYASHEKAHVEAVSVTIEMPFTVKDLVRRLVRVRRGSAAMRNAAARGDMEVAVRPADPWSWVRDVVLREPRLALKGVVYASITIFAATLARHGGTRATKWGRDESTRR